VIHRLEWNHVDSLFISLYFTHRAKVFIFDNFYLVFMFSGRSLECIHTLNRDCSSIIFVYSIARSLEYYTRFLRVGILASDSLNLSFRTHALSQWMLLESSTQTDFSLQPDEESCTVCFDRYPEKNLAEHIFSRSN